MGLLSLVSPYRQCQALTVKDDDNSDDDLKCVTLVRYYRTQIHVSQIISKSHSDRNYINWPQGRLGRLSIIGRIQWL